MDSELERYHKSCAALELNVGEGRLKQGGLHKELARQRAQTQDAHQAIRSHLLFLSVAVLFLYSSVLASCVCFFVCILSSICTLL